MFIMRYPAIASILLSVAWLAACGSDPGDAPAPEKRATSGYQQNIDQARQAAEQMNKSLAESSRQSDEALK